MTQIRIMNLTLPSLSFWDPSSLPRETSNLYRTPEFLLGNITMLHITFHFALSRFRIRSFCPCPNKFQVHGLWRVIFDMLKPCVLRSNKCLIHTQGGIKVVAWSIWLTVLFLSLVDMKIAMPPLYRPRRTHYYIKQARYCTSNVLYTSWLDSSNAWSGSLSLRLNLLKSIP